MNAADAEVDGTKHDFDQELILPKVNKADTNKNRLRIDTNTDSSTTTADDDKLSISVDGSIPLPRSTTDDIEDRGHPEHKNSGKPHGHDPVDEFDFDDYEALTLDSTVNEEDDEAPGMGTDDGSCSGIGIIIGTSHHDMTITTPFYPTLEQNNISPMARYRRRASQ